MTRTIVLAGGGTGGHVFPMIAVADALRKIDPSLRLVFVGTERGMEASLVPERGYELEFMRVLPIRGGGARGVLRGVVRAAGLIPEGRGLLQRLQPQAVFSIGGYAAGPVCVAARSLGIPLALMEPNSVIGLANWLIARLVQRAYVAFPESKKHFSRAAVVDSGVPIRNGFGPREFVGESRDTLRVLVLGGSQGARSLNQDVPLAIAGLSAPLQVTHQAGRDNQREVSERYRTLGVTSGVEVREFIDDMPRALADADLVISRSGASAVSEICAVGRPSILVPYPYAAGDHQRHNALSLERDGAAVCLARQELSADRLGRELRRMTTERGVLARMARAALERGRPEAARTIALDLLELAGIARTTSDPHSEVAPGSQRGGNSVAQFTHQGGVA